MRATVKDVARLAEVSPKTVSNVVNGTAPVSDAMRARVEAAMLELDYVPNFSARALRNGRSGLIALALPDLSTPYSAELAHHFVTIGSRTGLRRSDGSDRPQRRARDAVDLPGPRASDRRPDPQPGA